MNTQEVDTQRVLWGVVAVSLLVIVVLAGGLYFLRPQGSEERVVAVMRVDEPVFDPFAYVRDDRETPGLIETLQPVHQVSLVVGESETPVNVPVAPPKTEQVTAVASVMAPAVSAQVPAMAPAVDGLFQYWVQVGSFSSQPRANELQRLVDDLGYSGRVVTHDTEGAIMYRVRIGPYTSRPEADRLLVQLRKANDMDGWVARVSG